jgi:hypothetical protein
MTDTVFKQGDRVSVLPLGTVPPITGTVRRVRHDDRGVPLLTLILDDPTQTPDGLFIARPWEVALTETGLRENRPMIIANECNGSGPHSGNEVRVLPHNNTPLHGNDILCRACFNREIAYRRERNQSRLHPLADDAKFDLPNWEDLEVYP